MNHQDDSTKQEMRYWGSVLLICGSCIGAGVLGLPLAASPSGLYPSLLLNIVCWLFMVMTGLLFLEATLWLPDKANILSISSKILGRWGAWVSGFLFIFIYYSLMVSYLAGGPPLFQHAIKAIVNLDLDGSTAFWSLTLFLMLIVTIGPVMIVRANWLLILGLITAFSMLIGVGGASVDTSNYKHIDWQLSFFSTPVLFAAYGFHNVIPSITSHMSRNAYALKKIIITGTIIPFILYCAWLWMTLGMVSSEDMKHAHEHGMTVCEVMFGSNNAWLNGIVTFFGFFAITTSILGVALSMVDFFGDGIKKQPKGSTRVILTSIVFLPPAIFAFYHPGIFEKALGIAGGLGESFLNGLLPILLVWIGRYSLKLKSNNCVPGGKPMLLLLTAFTFCVIAAEILSLSTPMRGKYGEIRQHKRKAEVIHQ